MTACADAAAPSVQPGQVCHNCAIQLQEIARLDDSFDPGVIPDRMAFVTRLRNGRLVTVARDANSILVFSPSGKLLRRIGSAGGGPGEFRRIRRVMVDPYDTLRVHDWGNARLTTIGPDLELVRSQSMQYLPSVVLPSGVLVVAEHIMTPDLIGYPIHSLSAAGDLIKSFGTAVPEYAPDARLATTRLAASTADSQLWTVPPGRYMLERWDPATGVRTDSFEIASPWIKPIRSWPTDETVRPPGVIESLWVDDVGRIFLVLRIADRNWAVRDQPNSERAITAEEYDRIYDWIIEVVDPESRSVIASSRFPVALWGRPSSGVLMSTHRDTTSIEPEFLVWQPTLIESERPQ